jgi:hypothetical protein
MFVISLFLHISLEVDEVAYWFVISLINCYVIKPKKISTVSIFTVNCA